MQTQAHNMGPKSARCFSSGAQLLHASCGVWQSN